MKSDLVAWFIKNRRDLPWRKNLNPYKVWVSEVMLQQTRVEVVIPYFHLWMKHFPSIERLAAADLSEVIKTWEGLGYYSRARKLHEGARFVQKKYGGKLPDARELLLEIPGVGPYTAGAICSFAFKKRAFAIDGNVKRVISRLAFIQDKISTRAAEKKIEMYLQQFLPSDHAHISMEALIELGALVCKKRPLCIKCPLQDSCEAYKKGKASFVPVIGKKSSTIHQKRTVLCLMHQGKILVRKYKEGLLQDLWNFFVFEEHFSSHDLLVDRIAVTWGFLPQKFVFLGKTTQTFTRYQVCLHAYLVESPDLLKMPEYEWKSLHEIDALAFCSGHRRIKNHLMKRTFSCSL